MAGDRIRPLGRYHRGIVADTAATKREKADRRLFLTGAVNGALCSLFLGVAFHLLDQRELSLLQVAGFAGFTAAAVVIFLGFSYLGMWLVYGVGLVLGLLLVLAVGPLSGWGYYIIIMLVGFPLVFASYSHRRSTTRGAFGVVAVALVALAVSFVLDPPITLSPATTRWTHMANFTTGVLVSLVGAIAHFLRLQRTQQEIAGLRAEVAQARELGQYTLLERLGEGGMGQVYRARHALLRRPAAIKILREEVGEQALARFEREVQLTSELTHPNTIVIYDYGRTPEGTFYYVMEHLEGMDLHKLVKRYGPQHPARVIDILGQVCEALEEAHQRGLVHRDIKPANIFLCRRESRPDMIKVLDFGLVRDLVNEDLSAESLVAGTPDYMAPEAILDPRAVGPRSDIYALGAVGYFLLTGERVFSVGTVAAVCLAHVQSEPVPPRERLGAPVPEALESILLKCLQKDPEQRPASALELREALAALEVVPGWGEHEARQWWLSPKDDVDFSSRASSEITEQTLTVDVARIRMEPRLHREKADGPQPAVGILAR